MASDEQLEAHLARMFALTRSDARRAIDEVRTHFGETAEAYVRRRHRELQHTGTRNPDAFARIRDELSGRPVAAPPLTERQIRRCVYG